MVALLEAAAGGHIDVMRLLLDAGTPVDHCDFKGRTALLCAAEERHYDAVTFLLESGAQAQRDHKQVVAAVSGEPQEAEPPSFLQQAIVKVSPLARAIIETRESEAASSAASVADTDTHAEATGKQRRKERRRQRKEFVLSSDACSAAADAHDDCSEEGWQHGVFAVPAVPPDSYPATRSLLQSPFPWGEPHVSCYPFVPALPRDAAQAAKAGILSLPRPTLGTCSLQEREGWRRNLVMSFECTDAAALRPVFPGSECFTREKDAPVGLKVNS